jgi:hypothetical protein
MKFTNANLLIISAVVTGFATIVSIKFLILSIIFILSYLFLSQFKQVEIMEELKDEESINIMTPKETIQDIGNYWKNALKSKEAKQ